MKKEKLKPLMPEEWPLELEEICSSLVTPLNIHNIMAHHPELLNAWMPFRNHVVGGSSLSARHRELIILRTAHICQASYEWHHHVERGLAAGLNSKEICRVKEGANAAGWQHDEVALLNAVDDCHGHNQIEDCTMKNLRGYFNAQQQLDILVTVGMYRTLALVIKTYDVPMEDT